MSVDNSPMAADELPEDPHDLRDMIADLADEVSQLRAENEQLRERVGELEDELANQESIQYRGDVKQIENLVVGGIPVGNSIASNKQGRKNLNRIVFGNPNPDIEKSDIEPFVEEHGTVKETVASSQPATESESVSEKSRENMLPLHRMMIDMNSGAGASLNKAQKRAAALYERFANKAKGETNQNVTPDGQKYTMNTEQAVEVLEDEGLLESLKPQSYSKTAGRVMRDVQRFTIVDEDDHEECIDIDKCSEHGLVNFRPGKPHTLTVEKRKIEASVHNADASDKDVRTDGESQISQESEDEASTGSEFDQLNQASAVNNDD
jgi:regulator of replication initiation timing